MATHMAVFYETTNIIDIYIQNAPYCSSFNNNKIVGIQNVTGTIAYVPPDRNNTGNWSAQEEAWRFTPAGETIVEFEWLDSGGNLISNEPTFEVLPSETISYTAKVTYTTCTGNVTVVEDEITINVDDAPFTVDAFVEVDDNGSVVPIFGDDIDLCIDDLPITIDSGYASACLLYTSPSPRD
mgnify:FL=1